MEKYCFQIRFKNTHRKETPSSFLVARVAISFLVLPEYRSTNGIETSWGSIAFEETEIQLFVAIANGERHGDPRRPKEDHRKLIFFRFLSVHSFSCPPPSFSFLYFRPTSAEIAVLLAYTSRRQDNTLAAIHSYERSWYRLFRYYYVTESHLCPVEKSELYHNSVSTLERKPWYYFRYLDSRV